MINLGDLILEEAEVQEMGCLETTEPIECEVTVSTCRLPVLVESLGMKPQLGVITDVGTPL